MYYYDNTSHSSSCRRLVTRSSPPGPFSRSHRRACRSWLDGQKGISLYCKQLYRLTNRTTMHKAWGMDALKQITHIQRAQLPRPASEGTITITNGGGQKSPHLNHTYFTMFSSDHRFPSSCNSCELFSSLCYGAWPVATKDMISFRPLSLGLGRVVCVCVCVLGEEAPSPCVHQCPGKTLSVTSDFCIKTSERYLIPR